MTDRLREIAQQLREQITEECKDSKLPSGVHVQWDSVDLSVRAMWLAIEATRLDGKFTPMCSTDCVRCRENAHERITERMAEMLKKESAPK